MSAEDVIANAKEVLDAVRHAAEDFQSAPSLSRAKTAIRNFLEQGRSVTWALHHLKGEIASEDEWGPWWDTAMREIRSDPACQWFYQLRNPIVKEGKRVDLKVRSRLEGTFTLPPPGRPEGATGYVMDAHMVGWWTMPDGSRVPAAPVPGVKRSLTLAGLPEELRWVPFPELMERYIDRLEGVIRAAESHFLKT